MRERIGSTAYYVLSVTPLGKVNRGHDKKMTAILIENLDTKDGEKTGKEEYN